MAISLPEVVFLKCYRRVELDLTPKREELFYFVCRRKEAITYSGHTGLGLPH
jgi:hypothetical protein